MMFRLLAVFAWCGVAATTLVALVTAFAPVDFTIERFTAIASASGAALVMVRLALFLHTASRLERRLRPRLTALHAVINCPNDERAGRDHASAE